jgi:hypothetical protein
VQELFLIQIAFLLIIFGYLLFIFIHFVKLRKFSDVFNNSRTTRAGRNAIRDCRRLRVKHMSMGDVLRHAVDEGTG